jgi:hypothetical protein
MPRRQATYGTADGDEPRPELADVGRLARRFMQKAVTVARAGQDPVRQVLTEHLGTDLNGLPIATGAWPAYDQVNVQTGLEAWLGEPGRTHELVGLTNFKHRDFGLADLMQDIHFGPGVGNVATASLPAGPGGVTRPCVTCGLYFSTDEDGKAVIFVRAPDPHTGINDVTVQVACTAEGRSAGLLERIRQLSLEHNVFRGQVISFEGEVFNRYEGALLNFVERPHVPRDHIVLPDAVIDGIERQVLGVAKHASRLLASGQHLRRGVLLYGPPGTGKTHTVRYLLGRLPGVTAILLSGGALGMIGPSCSVARALQPSVVVVEDVDLIAEERGHYPGQNAMLFELLNEMDGLSQDIDVTFLLTTNRADLLEAALATRPGRVDHAAELALPDANARARLVELYRGNLELELADMDSVISRTEGVTASFIKELLRRAAMHAAEQDSEGAATEDLPLRVTDEHLAVALDELLDTRNALTRALLGGAPGAPVTALASDE